MNFFKSNKKNPIEPISPITPIQRISRINPISPKKPSQRVTKRTEQIPFRDILYQCCQNFFYKPFEKNKGKNIDTMI